MSEGAPHGRLFAFPRRGIAYVDCLYQAMDKQGVTAQEGDRSAIWLLRNVRRGDTLHLHWPSFFYYDAGSRLHTLLRLLRFMTVMSLAKLRGAQILWTAHNLYPHSGGRELWVHRVARKLVVRIASHIFSHGPRAAELLQAEFNPAPEKTVLVPHGHWIDYYPATSNREEMRRQLGIPSASFVYGFIGGCRPYKGLEHLIEAFRDLPGEGVLLIAGEFKSAAYLQHIRSRLASQFADRVLLLPRFLPDDEIRSYIYAIDALVLPYKQILTSGSIMLGLSFGRPVVVPDIGGMSDVIGEQHGLLYDPSSPTGLADALQEIRSRPYDAERIILHARSFEWSKSAHAVVTAVKAHAMRTKGRGLW